MIFFLTYRKGSLPNGVHSKRRPECAGRIQLMAMTALMLYRVAEKPGTATGYCGCHTLAQSEALTAYLLERVFCHDTKDQPPGPHPPQGMKRMPHLSLLLCPAFLQIVLCSLPLYPVIFSLQSIGNFTQSMLSEHWNIHQPFFIPLSDQDWVEKNKSKNNKTRQSNNREEAGEKSLPILPRFYLCDVR